MNNTYLCPAKVNLFLYITGKRDDGYHNIFSLFYPISLYDKLTIEKSDITKLSCNNENIPVDENNIIIKTHNILKNEYSLQDKYNIILEKNIPTGAGLGGGSSNAAYYLKAVNKLSNLNLSYDEMVNIMARVGSDTIFFLKSEPAIALGRGEILQPAPKLPKLYFVIINPNIHISTKEIYTSENLELTNINTVNMMEKEYNFKGITKLLANDMQKVVFLLYNTVKEIVDFLNTETNGYGLMSGSGSTVFAIYENEQAQLEAYEKAKNKYNTYYIEKVALATRG